MTISLRVCKLGGSLLDDPNLSQRIQKWLARQSPMPTVIIVGGGPNVDSIRQRWNTGLIDDLSAHWEAVEMMSENTKSVQRSIPNSVFCETIEEIDQIVKSAENQQLRQHRTIFLDALHYLQTADCDFPDGRLPASWDVTSDSIAARVARFLRADELILWKSTSSPNPATISHAQTAQFVDSYFSRAAAELKNIGWVDLRSDTCEEGWLQTG